MVNKLMNPVVFMLLIIVVVTCSSLNQAKVLYFLVQEKKPNVYSFKDQMVL